MRCPQCAELDQSSSASQVAQSPDNATLKISQFADACGHHYHDPRIWTAQLRCSEGHTFTIRQRVPCTVPNCMWNDDPVTRPEVIA